MSDLVSKCEICKGLLDEEDLFCANCGTEAPHREKPSQDAARTSTHNFQCSGCGASMSYDASAGRLRCPFCGSENLEHVRDARVMAPHRVVPFVLDKQSAVDAMRQWLAKGFWRPKDLSEEALVVSMTEVYVPYWVFDATTHTYWTADTSQTPAGARGDWYPISGDHHGSHVGLLVGASGALTPGETAAICPFNLSEGINPDSLDLDNVTIEQFSVPRKYARPLARQGIESLEAKVCDQQYVPGKSRNVQVNTRIEGLSSEPVLLPVWMMAYRYKEKVYRFLVNGQTGKPTGTAPFSYKKLLVITGAVVAGIVLTLLLIGVFDK
ncbi:MAG: hypothetical protein N2C12_06820 [Planctomycetales bacterium]